MSAALPLRRELAVAATAAVLNLSLLALGATLGRRVLPSLLHPASGTGWSSRFQLMQIGIEVLVALLAALAVALLASRLSRAPLRSALLVGAVAAVASWSSPAVMIAGEGPLLPALLRAAAPALVVLLLTGRPR